MNIDDIDKLFTATHKREIRNAITDYIYRELEVRSQEVIREIAAEWFKTNRQAVVDQFEVEMKKQIPRMVKAFVESALRRY